LLSLVSQPLKIQFKKKILLFLFPIKINKNKTITTTLGPSKNLQFSPNSLSPGNNTTQNQSFYSANQSFNLDQKCDEPITIKQPQPQPQPMVVTRSVSSSSSSTSKYNSSAHRPQSRNNSSRIITDAHATTTQIPLSSNSNNNNNNYDYDNLNYENFLAATSNTKRQISTSNTTPNIIGSSRAIDELSNLIANSNILIPVNTLPAKVSSTQETTTTSNSPRSSYTRSRSQGPIVGASSGSNQQRPYAPVLEKKSLDKFLKLASNSASLLDINSSTHHLQQQQQQSSNSNSSNKLKTSSSNILALCGTEIPNPIINNNNTTTNKSERDVDNSNEQSYMENLKNNLNRRPQTLKFDGQTHIIKAKMTTVLLKKNIYFVCFWGGGSRRDRI
jgi:hypothetical protein